MQGRFWFRNLQYYSNGWQTWPYSGTSQNRWNYVEEQALQFGAGVTPNHCADIYGLTLYDRWNPWAWFTGTGGKNCGHIFPPIAYDDANAAMTYTGNWTYNDTCCLKAWKGTLHWTNTTNDKVTLNNTTPTSSITRVYTKAPNRGNSKVKIGGTTYNFNDNDTFKLWQVAKTWSVAGTINVEITNDCCNYIDNDAILIDVPRTGAGTYENKYYLIRYLGDYWTHRSQGLSGPSASALSWSAEPESAVTFTFTGNKITYYFTRASNRGIARVTIDGVFKMDINACSGAIQWGQSQEFNNLGAGVHTIQIANTGTTTCQPAGQPIDPYRFIDVDKFVVAN